MDDELKAIAGLELCNAFWTDFSALVNHYLIAASGLDLSDIEMQMGDKTSIYGRDTSVLADFAPNIYTQNGPNRVCTTGWTTLLDALDYEAATQVYVQSRLAFERDNVGEWQFVDYPVAPTTKERK